ncbi:50S ribosomal protein L32e [Candidatus Pacearchaeota archaeon]|jgi:ribosomal protein L32E|nr:50S ribosomal protein L32e [Candidatus Pacearchaeota archaeon]
MTEKKLPTFLRRHTSFRSRLGRNRKKIQTWRRATGRHNKVRLKRKGYPIKVMIGFRTAKEGRDLIQDTKPIMVMNVKELIKVGKGQSAIIGKVGNKKRLEILKIAKEKKIIVANLNVKKKLKSLESKMKKESKK